MRSRDALALAVVLAIVAVAVLALTTSSGGGMMGGMMGGAMAGVWVFLAFLLIAVVLVLLALAGNSERGPIPFAAPPPPPNAAPYATPPAPPSDSPAPPTVTSDVEAAIVRMLDEDERLLYLRLRDAGGPVLQKDVVAWRTFSPAKVTRLLDRLEAKGLVVRERSGATNRIRLTRQPVVSGK